jgi:hypothetical protein
MIMVGLYGGEIPLSLVAVVQRAITIRGSNVGTVAELKQVVELARAGKLKPIPVEKRPLSEVSRTLDELKAGTIVGRLSRDLKGVIKLRKCDESVIEKRTREPFPLRFSITQYRSRSTDHAVSITPHRSRSTALRICFQARIVARRLVQQLPAALLEAFHHGDYGFVVGYGKAGLLSAPAPLSVDLCAGPARCVASSRAVVAHAAVVLISARFGSVRRTPCADRQDLVDDAIL